MPQAESCASQVVHMSQWVPMPHELLAGRWAICAKAVPLLCGEGPRDGCTWATNPTLGTCPTSTPPLPLQNSPSRREV